MSDKQEPAATLQPGEGEKTAAPGVTPNDLESDDSSPNPTLENIPEWARKELETSRKELKELKGEARDRRLKAREKEETNKAAQDKALADQQEWQKLAEQRAADIAHLKPIAEQFDELQVLFDKQYKGEIKDWPQDLLEMAPSDDSAITVRLAWLEKARPMAKKLLGQSQADTSTQKQPAAGNRRGPDPTNQAHHQQPPARKDAEGPLVDVRSKF